MKYCVVIADGIADRPHPRLKNKTPLQAARTPAMDKLARHGRMGMVQTIPAELYGDSLIANMAIFGYDPAMYYSGRAAFEARAMGIELGSDDWAFCCDLISTFDGTIADPCAGQIRQAEAELLLEDLRKHFQLQPLEWYSLKNHHSLLITRGMPLADFKLAPPYNIIGEPMVDHYPQGQGSDCLIQILEQSQQLLLSHEVNTVRRDLRENPADSLWIWGGGILPTLPPFDELTGKRAAVITAALELQGLAQSAEIKVIKVPGITSSWDTNYQAQKISALQTLENFDLVFIHIGAAAYASRHSDISHKVRVIEQIDANIVAPLTQQLPRPYRLLVTAGHAVYAGKGSTGCQAVPFVIGGSDLPGGAGLGFSEDNAKKIDLCINDGDKLIAYLFELA